MVAAFIWDVCGKEFGALMHGAHLGSGSVHLRAEQLRENNPFNITFSLIHYGSGTRLYLGAKGVLYGSFSSSILVRKKHELDLPIK